MAQEYSFDVVSKVDMQELRNAVDQARREIGTRFDFKDSISEIEFEDEGLKLSSDNDYRLKALREVLQSKLIRRSVPLEAFEYGKVEEGSHGAVRQHVKLKQGIDADTGRAMVKKIKDLGLKVQTQFQGDQLRVSGKNKDDLQKAMNAIRKEEFGVAVQFVNYR
ncbi:MAG TPA: YajQ family cyclic di-GMP-binding protein [Armatimonadota bacterium]|nr:YajQ family cyclic di-GMP-binding protein [Armatimonadota bacterium]